VIEGAAAFARRLSAPMVGRAAELAALQAAFDQAARDRAPRLVTVLGPPGIGKSRLTLELTRGLDGEARVLTGRCLSYGEGITFLPLTEIVRELDLGKALAGEDDATLVEGQLRAAVGLAEATGSIEETFWAVRKLVEALAREQPLVLVLEDIHWAEPTFLDLIEYLADWTRDVALLIVCLARGELLDVRPSWRGARLALEPLSETEAAGLIDRLLGDALLPEPSRARIVAAAEGNPLFVEQMLALAEERPGEEPIVPPTISALLAARLDRLEPEERAVLERAAVAGKVFYWSAVAHLCPPEIRPRAGSHLLSLVRKDLIAPERSDLPREDAFRFRHILIRDAAYAGIPKQARAELHERFAGWVDARWGERASEVEEIIGYHLEQAYRFRTELAPADDRARALATRAAERLASAGRKASDRGDSPAAANLLGRAAALLPERDRARLELLLELAEALMDLGKLDDAGNVLAELADVARHSGERGLRLHAQILDLHLKFMTDPEGRSEEARLEAERAIPVLEELGADRALASAWHLLGRVHLIACRSADMEAALEPALIHAERAGDTRERGEILFLLLVAVADGPTPVAEAIHRIGEILTGAGAEPKVRATALELLGQLYAAQGRFEEASALSARGQAIHEDLGMRVTSAAMAVSRAWRLLLADDPVTAERELLAAYEFLAAAGEKGYLSTVAAFLAKALYAQGRYQEADEFARRGREAAATGDVISQITWRGVTAKVLARSGRFAEAEALAREGVDLAQATDWLEIHGNALMDLAEVVRVAGRSDEAVAAIEAAVELYERKGIVVSAAKARALIAELDAARTT